MSSDLRAPAQIPANKLYTNLASLASTIFDGQGVATSNITAWSQVPANATILSGSAGSVVLRDMGKTVYLPAGSTSATQSTVLRKVQLVTNTSVAGPVPTGTGIDAGYFTGYIQMGGLTYGGGNGSAAPVARLN